MTRNYRNFARSLDRPARPYTHWLRLLLDAGCGWDEADRVARSLGEGGNA